VGLLILLFPVLEIITTIRIGGQIGFMNTVFAFAVGGILGYGIVKSQGRFLLGGITEQLQRGEIPANKALHSMLIFVGGIALMIPGFLSDAVGIVFILPGTRHLIAYYLKRTFEKKLKSGSFRVFSSGNFGSFRGFGGGFGGGFDPTRNPQNPSEGFRDVTPREVTGEVIEAEVVSSSSRSSDDSGDRGSN